MTSNIQRAQLQAQIWKIANEVRGAVDGWDFKQFVFRVSCVHTVKIVSSSQITLFA